MKICNDTETTRWTVYTGQLTAENYLQCARSRLRGSVLARNLQITFHKFTNTVSHMLGSHSNAYMFQQRVTERQYTNTRMRIIECSSLKLSRSSMNEKTNYEEERHINAAKRMREGESKRERKEWFCFVLWSWLQRNWVIWTLRQCSCVTCCIYESYVLLHVHQFIVTKQLRFTVLTAMACTMDYVTKKNCSFIRCCTQLMHWFYWKKNKNQYDLEIILMLSMNNNKDFTHLHKKCNMQQNAPLVERQLDRILYYRYSTKRRQE